MNVIESSSVVIMSKSDLAGVIEATAKQAVAEAIKKLPRENQPRPFHVNIKQACEMTGCGRSKIDGLIKSGILKLNQAGLIPIGQIDDLVGL